MDDLVELDWGSQPSQRPSNAAGASSYQFDALLRSMPSQTSSTAPKPAQKSVQHPAPVTRSSDRSADDAFSSLLPSFGTSVKPSCGSSAQAVHPVPAKAPQAPKVAPSEDLWGWDAFESKATAQPSSRRPASAPRAPVQHTAKRPGRPPARDYTDLLGKTDGEDDELLGDLGPSPPTTATVPASPPPMRGPRRGSSPPPHIVGRLVEMGYGPLEARQALAATPSGQDVDHALTLLKASEPVPSEPVRPSDPPKPMKQERVRGPMDRGPPAAPSAHREGPASLHQQADQLYAHASELGTAMLKNANAWWGTAKAQAQKALDEASRESNSRGSAVAMAAGLSRHAMRRWGGQAKAPLDYDARPRWMDEAEVAQSKPAGAPASAPRPAVSKAPTQPPPTDGCLFCDPPPSPSSRAPAAAPRSPPRPAPSRTVSAPAAVVRTVAPEDAGVVAHAMRLKEEGNKHFVKGAYADAEVQYTRALEVLPRTSLWRVPLLNNRANVRLKNGDGDGTIADCALCVELIVLPSMPDGLYRPSKDALPSSHAPLNLREAYAKSLSQRARAHEMLEKWALARQDWAQLLSYERLEGSGVKSGAMHRRAASEGTARCDRMLKPVAPQRPARVAVPTATAPKASAEGVARMREIHQAQDAEEEQRLQHKDSVDARIAAWTKGKETNVRALLASVDDPQYRLVWPALRWKKVGLHELLSEAQVKRAYTKAIARLHPDKLSPSDTSVEQRMLAAGMFHALNAAFHS